MKQPPERIRKIISTMVIWKDEPDPQGRNSRARDTWQSLMQKTKELNNRIWGEEKIPERDEDE